MDDCHLNPFTEDWTQEAEDEWRAKMARHDAELALVRKQREEAIIQRGQAQFADDLCALIQGNITKEEFLQRNDELSDILDSATLDILMSGTAPAEQPKPDIGLTTDENEDNSFENWTQEAEAPKYAEDEWCIEMAGHAKELALAREQHDESL